MRLQIHTGNLDELSEKGKQKLRDWYYYPEEQFLQIVDDITHEPIDEKHSLNFEFPRIGMFDWVVKYGDGIPRERTVLGVFSESLGYGIKKEEVKRIVEKSKQFLPLLTIGQMIKFLGDEWIKHPLIRKKHSNKELCDSLWRACKEKLESE